jgi:hypothetical protein
VIGGKAHIGEHERHHPFVVAVCVEVIVNYGLNSILCEYESQFAITIIVNHSEKERISSSMRISVVRISILYAVSILSVAWISPSETIGGLI